MDESPLLRFERARKSFGRNEVLRGVTLDVTRHTVVVCIGASGSGKSTLLRCANLLETVTDGQIFLNGEDISDPRRDADAVRRKIGIVFQSFNLFPHMTVLDNVTLSLRKVVGMPRGEAEERGMALLKRIGIEAKARVYPDRLSGGQQQRVAIVRAIASDPELLLLDEITSALDPQLVGEVLDLVLELKSTRATILMATHEMSFARSAADDVVFLHNGVIEESGPPDKIFGEPEKPATRAFLERFRV
ncbi:MAG: amino acid ABC transporter ATP-binding protein [Oscillospiraceae bacterium]|jgi:polar amino acid transport system ATP-binding protein|nr:amino acid ABC transporter ATP-binding protein [Oscillospiraceae bacterium]